MTIICLVYRVAVTPEATGRAINNNSDRSIEGYAASIMPTTAPQSSLAAASGASTAPRRRRTQQSAMVLIATIAFALTVATAAPDAVAAPVESVGLTTRGLQKRRRVRMEPAVVPYDEMLHNNRTGHCTEPVEDSGSSVTKMGQYKLWNCSQCTYRAAGRRYVQQ